MFVIKRLWIDTWENNSCNAWGHQAIGVVRTKEESDRICGLAFTEKAKYPWPLDYAWGFKGDVVPDFIAEEVTDLTGMDLEELRGIKR